MKGKFITLAALTLALSSCGIKDGLDKTRENAELASLNSSCISEMNSDMRLLMGPSGASTKREDNWKFTGMGNDLTNMAVYMKAQDFSLQSNITCAQTEASSDASYLNAANEFTTRMSDVSKASGDSEIVIANLFSKDIVDLDADVLKAQKTFVAYAATMHAVSDFREIIAKRKGKKNIAHYSMYDLLKNSLIKERSLELGDISL